jgi:RNA polymerase sigma-70 factor, ECF subfamily
MQVATDRTDSLAIGAVRSLQDARFEEATAEYGAALARLARAYEPDPDKRKDLLQEILIGLWRSFAAFDERCSTRTWVYRVAHNVATSKVLRRPTAHVDAASIGEITGLSARNVSTKIHRIKQVLAKRFHEGSSHGR